LPVVAGLSDFERFLILLKSSSRDERVDGSPICRLHSIKQDLL
jgi:hypothetical protein